MRFVELKDAPKRKISLKKSFMLAEEIVEAANSQAFEVSSTQLLKVKEIREEAKKTGYIDGQKRAVEELLSATTLRSKTLQSMEDTLLLIITELTQEVIAAELKLQPEAIVRRIQRALAYAINSFDISIVVSPGEGDLIEEALKTGSSAFSSDEPISIVRDEKMMPGSFRIKTDLGIIESSITDHLESLLLQLSQLGIIRSEASAQLFANEKENVCR